MLLVAHLANFGAFNFPTDIKLDPRKNPAARQRPIDSTRSTARNTSYPQGKSKYCLPGCFRNIKCPCGSGKKLKKCCSHVKMSLWPKERNK